MTLWDSVQGIQNLNIDSNLYYQHPNHHHLAYSNLFFHQKPQMHGLKGGDFIPLRSRERFASCKKTFIAVNNDGSVTFPHGGKKRRENDNCYRNRHCTPWIVRNYCSGMIGLHEEIEDFYHYMRPTNEEHRMREHVIQSVRDVVLRLWPAAKLDVFGSFRTNLYLPTSDIDIVVFGNWEHLPLWTLREELIKVGITDESSVKVLDRAAVPIIKFNHLEAQVRVDVSFNTKSGVQCVQLIKDFIKQYPVLPKLVFVLKQFLVMRELNEVWTGGLSSYSVLLLCVSFLQMHPRPDARDPNSNLGALLIEFFELYGRCFQYEDICISVKDGGRYKQKTEFCQQFDNGFVPSLLCIEDPLTEGNDLGKGSYGMLQVKRAFDFAYCRLHSTMCRHNYNSERRSTSYLSLVVEISEGVIAKRQAACDRWQMYVSASPLPLVEVSASQPCPTDISTCSTMSSSDANTNSTYTSSEECSSSTSSESDLEEQISRIQAPPHITTEQKSASAAKSKTSVPQDRKPQILNHKEGENETLRTRSTEGKRINSSSKHRSLTPVLARFVAKDNSHRQKRSPQRPASAEDRLLSTKEHRHKPTKGTANEKTGDSLKPCEPAVREKPEKLRLSTSQTNSKKQSRNAVATNRGHPSRTFYNSPIRKTPDFSNSSTNPCIPDR